MAGMLNLGNIFELVNDSFDNGAFTTSGLTQEAWKPKDVSTAVSSNQIADHA